VPASSPILAFLPVPPNTPIMSPARARAPFTPRSSTCVEMYVYGQSGEGCYKNRQEQEHTTTQRAEGRRGGGASVRGGVEGKCTCAGTCQSRGHNANARHVHLPPSQRLVPTCGSVAGTLPPPVHPPCWCPGAAQCSSTPRPSPGARCSVWMQHAGYWGERYWYGHGHRHGRQNHKTG
jgi:hypothetical protein